MRLVTVSVVAQAEEVGEMVSTLVVVLTETIVTACPLVVFHSNWPALSEASLVFEEYVNDSPPEAGAEDMVEEKRLAPLHDSVKVLVAELPAPS
jgi:hypothetical protein